MGVTSAGAGISVVLAHGGFEAGSGWQGVYAIGREYGAVHGRLAGNALRRASLWLALRPETLHS
jgi:hypothetical protein